MQPFVTGEAVALDLRPAALPSRVVAGLVDALLQVKGVGARKAEDLGDVFLKAIREH